jgi:hypothetical protein
MLAYVERLKNLSLSECRRNRRHCANELSAEDRMSRRIAARLDELDLSGSILRLTI